MSSQIIFKKREDVLYMITYLVVGVGGTRTWQDAHMCRSEKLHLKTLDGLKQQGRSVQIIATYEYRPVDTSRKNRV